MKLFRRIGAVLLCAALAGASIAGCQSAKQTGSGDNAYYSITSSLPSQAEMPEAAAYQTSSAVSVSSSPMSSDVPTVRKTLLQALKATNGQASFTRSVSRKLQVGQVELVQVNEKLQSATVENRPVQAGSMSATYKTETAQSLGLENTDFYFDKGVLHKITNLEDSANTANNLQNAVTVAETGASAEAAVPAFYLNLTDKMISSVDVSQNGSDILYSFTLDPENSRSQVIELLKNQTDRLEFEEKSFILDYNVCTARSDAAGCVTELSSSIGGRYKKNDVEQAGELTVKYTFSNLGTTEPPLPPAWIQ